MISDATAAYLMVLVFVAGISVGLLMAYDIAFNRGYDQARKGTEKERRQSYGMDF